MASICELSYASTRKKKPKVLSGFYRSGYGSSILFRHGQINAAGAVERA
jgi:hypothetical protein